MSAKPKKRSRAAADENRADCPFTVTLLPTPSREDAHKAKKRKREDAEDDSKSQLQTSPFKPTGKFKSANSMDIYYAVEPRKRWLGMTRYNSFVLNGTKYFTENYIYVANEATIERQKAGADPATVDGIKKSNDYWVARILEIRATDEFHVYARVFWMYSPDELPANTLDGKKMVTGRQPYHGQHELVASNHMDIINVVSVAMPATVNQWIETDDEEVQDALYWRQAYDCKTAQLSAVERTCKCDTPANPDKTLVGCTNSKCGKWLHYDCLLHDVLTRVYEQLGKDTPHKSPKPVVKEEVEDDKADQPMDTTEVKGEETDSKTTIDVKGGSDANHVPIKDVDVPTPMSIDTPTPGPPTGAAGKAAKSSTAKKGRSRKSITSKPYQGLFDATLKMNEGPTAWVVTDLRENITGGDQTWTEPAQCLVCGTTVD